MQNTTVSLKEYSSMPQHILNSPRSLIACRRTGVDPTSLVDPKLDAVQKASLVRGLQAEYAKIRVEGISETEFKSVGSPQKLLQFVQKREEGGSNQIEMLLERQQRELEFEKQRVARASQAQAELEKHNEETRKKQILKEKEREKLLKQQQEEMQQKLEAKMKRQKQEQEDIQRKLQQQKEEKALKQEEIAAQREKILREQQEAMQEKLHAKSDMNKQKVLMATQQAEQTAKQRLITVTTKLQSQNEKLEQQKRDLEEQIIKKTQQSIEIFEEKHKRIQEMTMKQKLEAIELRNHLESKLSQKEKLAKETLEEKREHFQQFNKEKSKRVVEITEFLNKKQQDREEKFMEKSEKELKERTQAEEKLAQSLNQFKQKVGQKFDTQQMLKERVEAENQYKQELHKSIVSLRLQKADEFVMRKKQFETDIAYLNQKNEAIKQYNEYTKYYSPDAWKWKAGLVNDEEILTMTQQKFGQQQPKKAEPRAVQSTVQLTRAESPTRSIAPQAAMARLKALMEAEEGRERQRAEQLRKCQPGEREELVQKHNKERVALAHKVDALRSEFK